MQGVQVILDLPWGGFVLLSVVIMVTRGERSHIEYHFFSDRTFIVAPQLNV